jgi:hypothetical protein
MSDYRTLSINSLERAIDEIKQNPSIGKLVYTNLDTLARCVDSIFRHNGDPSWVADVRDANGQPVFKSAEYDRIHKAVSVFFPMLYAFFGKQYEQPMQRGGNGDGTQPVDPIGPDDPSAESIDEVVVDNGVNAPAGSQTSSNEVVELKAQLNTEKKAREQLQSQVNELRKQTSTRSATNDSESPSMGVDALYRKVVDMLGQFNTSVVNFASTYGILKLEKSFDTELDPKPFLPLASVPGLQPLSQVPVPIRVIVLFLYTCLDIARVMISISPTDRPFIRKVLSIVMAVVDILRGDWKKALLSFSSYFSSDYAIMSVIGKVILDVGGLISPYLQYHMTYGLLDVSKSIVAGLFLSLFQTFAPFPLRQPVLEQIDVLRQIADENKALLEQKVANPEQRELYPSYLVPSFENIQTLQSVLINNELQCDERVVTAVRKIVGKPGNENIFMKIVLELLGIPVDPEELARKCPPTQERFGQAVADEAMEDAVGNEVVTPTTAPTPEQVASVSAPTSVPQATTVPEINPVSNTSEQKNTQSQQNQEDTKVPNPTTQ